MFFPPFNSQAQPQTEQVHEYTWHSVEHEREETKWVKWGEYIWL